MTKKYIKEKEIHDLVSSVIGKDIVHPVTYQILIELYRPPSENEFGISYTDQAIHMDVMGTMIGRVLRIGPDAFADERRFQSGKVCDVGDWVIFRGSERQRIRINDHDLAFINDDRILAITTEPDQVKTTFDLQGEYIG